jgi:hypothetical protein
MMTSDLSVLKTAQIIIFMMSLLERDIFPDRCIIIITIMKGIITIKSSSRQVLRTEFYHYAVNSNRKRQEKATTPTRDDEDDKKRRRRRRRIVQRHAVSFFRLRQ